MRTARGFIRWKSEGCASGTFPRVRKSVLWDGCCRYPWGAGPHPRGCFHLSVFAVTMNVQASRGSDETSRLSALNRAWTMLIRNEAAGDRPAIHEVHALA